MLTNSSLWPADTLSIAIGSFGYWPVFKQRCPLREMDLSPTLSSFLRSSIGERLCSLKPHTANYNTRRWRPFLNVQKNKCKFGNKMNLHQLHYKHAHMHHLPPLTHSHSQRPCSQFSTLTSWPQRAIMCWVWSLLGCVRSTYTHISNDRDLNLI